MRVMIHAIKMPGGLNKTTGPDHVPPCPTPTSIHHTNPAQSMTGGGGGGAGGGTQAGTQGVGVC
jgi:hypothetical protein